MQGFTTKYYLRKAERGDFVVNRQAVTLHTRKTCQVPLRHNSYQTARKRMCEYREEKISCKRLMVYKKGVAAKRKICRGIFFSFGCTMGPECFTKFGKRFSLVHQPIYMLNQSKLYLGRQICLPISFSLSLYELKKPCFSFGCNGSWKFKYNRRTRKKILVGSWFKKSRL